MNPPRQPRVGEVVHYYISEEPRAAMITELGTEGNVSLVIFYPSSISFASYAQYSETKEVGSWCFAEQVEEKTPPPIPPHSHEH